MKLSPKPVRKCYACELNLGKRCWAFPCPRLQWSGGKCPGFDNQELYRQFREWQEAPHVKTRKQLRREVFARQKTCAPRRHFRKVRLRRG